MIVPWKSILNTVPPSLAPPRVVVPYRLPSVPRTSVAYELAPSAGGPSNEWATNNSAAETGRAGSVNPATITTRSTSTRTSLDVVFIGNFLDRV